MKLKETRGSNSKVRRVYIILVCVCLSVCMCVIFNSIQCNIKCLGYTKCCVNIRILKRLAILSWSGPCCLILVAFFSLSWVREGKWNNVGKGPHTPMNGSNFSWGVFPRLIPQFHTLTPLDYIWICFLSPSTIPDTKCKLLDSRNLVYFLHCYIPAPRTVSKI